jgi:hypothetical protein
MGVKARCERRFRLRDLLCFCTGSMENSNDPEAITGQTAGRTNKVKGQSPKNNGGLNPPQCQGREG